MRTLLVVDLQPDFMTGGPLAVPDAEAVLGPIARALQECDHAVATQDWHPPGHLSFASSHPGRAPGQVIELDGIDQVLWPDHCVAMTPGAQIAGALNQTRVAAVFRKGMDPRIDSYSGFFDNARRRATGLEAYLRGVGASGLIVCGLATDYCVRATALDALSLGFEVALLRPACRGVDLAPGDSERALEEVRAAGASILDRLAL